MPPDVREKVIGLSRRYPGRGLLDVFDAAVEALGRMDLSPYAGRPMAIKPFPSCDRLPESPMPVVGVAEVRLIFTVPDAASDHGYAWVRHAWFPALPVPNSTRDI